MEAGSGFQLRRIGTIMEPERGNPHEAEGVLNPAAARGPDGHLYLFPRIVAEGNFSRIGVARVRFDSAGDPVGVERLGIALEPEADYELRPGGGGCEDPRITYVEPLQCYVMTYTAFSQRGPRIALAASKDLFTWRRLGLVTFGPYEDVDFNEVDNKDASIFPVAIADPSGRPSLAILHRPILPVNRSDGRKHNTRLPRIDHRESIWISYTSIIGDSDPCNLLRDFTSHHQLAAPVAPWEQVKVGGGTPPVLTPYGWLTLYHGVSTIDDPAIVGRKLRYSAGMMLLSREQPNTMHHRTPEPILSPETPEERQGVVANVVFPTGIDRRDDLGMPTRFDVYYGMADDRIGVARLDYPHALPLAPIEDSAERAA